MLRPSAEVPNLNGAYDRQLSEVADALTLSMREAANETKLAWREQIIGAGLGSRLANTIRANVYPKTGDALNPAGFIYTKAPAIIDAFSRGPIIRPVNGARFLWIPTANVPRKLGRGKGRMDPEEVELHFNSEMIIKPNERGQLQAFIEVIKGRGRGYRRATKGRLAQGREKELVLMFNLRRTVKMPKKLDLQVLADGGARSFAIGADARLGS